MSSKLKSLFYPLALSTTLVACSPESNGDLKIDEIVQVERKHFSQKELEILDKHFQRDVKSMKEQVSPSEQNECLEENLKRKNTLPSNITFKFNWNNINDWYYLSIISKSLSIYPKSIFKKKLEVVITDKIKLWKASPIKINENNLLGLTSRYHKNTDKEFIRMELRRWHISQEIIHHELSHYLSYLTTENKNLDVISKINSDNLNSSSKELMYVSWYSLINIDEDTATIHQKAFWHIDDIIPNIKFDEVFREKVEAYFGSKIDYDYLLENDKLRFRWESKYKSKFSLDNNYPTIYSTINYKTLNRLLETQYQINDCIKDKKKK